MMARDIRYNCKENDNHLVAGYVDGKLDEIWVGDAEGESHIVIDIKDLNRALRFFRRQGRGG